MKSSKNRMTFAAENFKSEKLSGHLRKTSLIIEKSERAKQAGNFFLMILLHI